MPADQTNTAEAVERLRTAVEACRFTGGKIPVDPADIAAALSRIMELEKALGPFADSVPWFDYLKLPNDDVIVGSPPTHPAPDAEPGWVLAGHFRTAARVLTEGGSMSDEYLAGIMAKRTDPAPDAARSAPTPSIAMTTGTPAPIATPEERLAVWMIEHSFATGHGDTFEDLLGELSAQVRKMQNDHQAFEERKWAQDADTPAPSATPEEVAFTELTNALASVSMQTGLQSFAGIEEGRPPIPATIVETAHLRTILAALASSKAEIERCHKRLEIDHRFVLRDGEMVEEPIPYDERASFPDGILARDLTIQGQDESIRALTDQVGRMREAAVRLVGAGLNEMAVKRLPLELSRHSALGAMLDALGVPNDEAEKPAAEWDRLLRAALSPTEPEALEK